ncbi:MAG: lactate racemase domain-containing protein [Hyphomicrobiaceae bacterium]
MDLGPIMVTIEGGMDYPMPALTPVAQHFDRPRVSDVGQAIRAEMSRIPAEVVAGKEISITVGSRGIAELPSIIRSLVTELRHLGAMPFIVPSMGSHGGATAQGQTSILAGYGITEDTVDAPIRSSMEVVEVCRLDDGTPLYIDRTAYQADGIVIANKIKPHADFKASYESGLVKMLCIGLGKHKGAVTLHDHGFGRFHDLLPRAATALLERLPVIFGLAILENAFDDLMHLAIVPKDSILDREKELLQLAKASIGRLLVPEIDVLIVDEIGKNISGEGMDPNVTGRPGSRLPGFDAPTIQKIVALGVTPQSHGNGVGIGSADISTRRCVEQIDLGAMYTNAITATILDPAKLPMIMNSDRDAICVALKTCNRITPETAKIVRIRNTLEVESISVSSALLAEVERNPRLSVLGDPAELIFDASGNLI